jgi:hypothetical protein
VNLALSWILFPLVLGALSLGLGSLLQRLTRKPLGVLLLPAGFAALVVLTQLPTLTSATARFGLPLAVLGAVTGLALLRPRSWRIERPAVAAAVATFAVYAAPVVLSGQATFAGYITLDDTATFLAITDRVLDHGRSLDGLEPSTYEVTLAVNLAHGYPIGTFTPLGVAARVVREDPAWVFQPYMAFAAALLALALYAIVAPLVRRPWARAGVAVVAAQPALLFAYSLWGGVKEIVAAALLATAAALVARRDLFGFAVAAAAVLGVLSAAGAVWLAPLALAAAVGVPRRRLGIAVGTAVVLALPTLAVAGDFLRADNRASFRNAEELGNLARALRLEQVLGVWPAADFRNDPTHLGLTRGLLVVVALAALAGAAVALRRRAPAPALYGLAALLGTVVFAVGASPWVEAKAYAMASPAILALALAALARHRWTVALAVLVAAGVGWSNVSAYANASLAPRHQLDELERAGGKLAGASPALLTDYQVYGARHFLRGIDGESASELRRRFVYLRDGSYLDKGASADIDAFRLDQVLVYRTLVLRRGPASSRPPSAYALAIPGRYYDAWLQVPGVRVLDHLPLGDTAEAGAVAACADVRRLAGLAGARELVAARAPLTIPLAPQVVGGALGFAGTLPRAGRYEVWLPGSFHGTLDVVIGGRTLERRGELNWTGLSTSFGTVDLPRGAVTAGLVARGSDLRPGSSGPSTIGPLTLTESIDRTLERVAPDEADTLCGKRWDWVEAVG